MYSGFLHTVQVLQFVVILCIEEQGTSPIESYRKEMLFGLQHESCLFVETRLSVLALLLSDWPSRPHRVQVEVVRLIDFLHAHE